MLPFQLVGVLLLTGIIGAVGLVQRRAIEDAPEFEPSGSVSIEEESNVA